MLPTKFQVNWPFNSGEEAKNRFSRWPPMWPSRISYRNNLSYFCSTNHPNASHQVQVNWPFGSGEGKIRFPIGKIIAIFDLQVTPMLPTKFQVSWLFSSGEEAKNRFSRWQPWQPS